MLKIGALTLALFVEAGAAGAQALPNAPAPAEPPLAVTDFGRALTTNDRYRRLSVNLPEVTFRPSEYTFAYRRSSHGEPEFLLVKAATGEKRAAFDRGPPRGGADQGDPVPHRGRSLLHHAATHVDREDNHAPGSVVSTITMLHAQTGIRNDRVTGRPAPLGAVSAHRPYALS
ncbi:hypothetical protein QA644_33585 (plasmid) [Rhizobium sp. CC1099]|uniref:hypothetical protein n=1 Tax=Rhizobium sp. CC1099 TaxID=3039160 RepID=UPI0024B181CD|nr:hypothetical protein [Rhizobium sp. CC1099]WFU92133.1 hypothetical protein QA644_33585 [Rhizobium sp. CC1099]